MAENEHLSDNEELLSPVKNDSSGREYTPPPRQKKHRIKRRPTHKATCPKNPSRRLIFSSQDERDPSPARQCNKNKRKMERRKSRRSKKQKFEGRDIEVSGTWVQCTNKDCMKWRYLSDITDPSHVSDIWTCEMNSDSSYNSCLLPEQDYSSLQFVHAKFTEGSLVWAKMQGFPWWPAMIEEDPDSELCLYPDPVTGYVTDYHVIFLDKKVTRCWVKVSNIQKYEGGACPGSMTVKGHDYSQKIMAAKEKADKAQKLPIEERIKTYGFSARFKGPWGEEEERTSDESHRAEPCKKKGLKPKKQVIVDEDSSLAGSLLSHSDMDDILDEAEALLGEVQNIVMEVEDEVQESFFQEMEIDEKESPSQKRKAEIGEADEPPAKQKKDMSKKRVDVSLPKEETKKTSKGKQSSEMKMSKELERIQKKKEMEMHKLELRELKERERIERREKEKRAKMEQRAREKQEKEEKKQRGKQEEKERKEKEKQEQKEKSKQEKKEMKQKEREVKKELKKKEKAEKKAMKKALEGETEPTAAGMETESDADKAARKEKKRLEKEERKRMKKEMKAKRKEERKKEGEDGKVTDPKEKGTEKVKPSFQKAKKPTFSAPKQKSIGAPPAPPPQPTPAEESSVSKEIGALISEIVCDKDQTDKNTFESPTTSTNIPVAVSTDLKANQASSTKNTKKLIKPKFSIKTKDGRKLSESNIIDHTTSPLPVLAREDGLNDLDEETSVNIAKILEVNTKQDSLDTTETNQIKESRSDPQAFPLSQMTGKQLELLPRPELQGDAVETKTEGMQSQDPRPTKEIDDAIAESSKFLKTLDPAEIQECSPDPTDWSEPDEPQTVPGQKRVTVAAVADGNDSDDSEPFDMEE